MWNIDSQSEKMRTKVVLGLLAVLVLASLGLATISSYSNLSPANNTLALNSTPAFFFNATSSTNATFSCSLLLNGTAYGTNATSQNVTITTITPNQSLAEGNYTWRIDCTDLNGTASSEPRFLYVDTVPNVTLVSPANGSGQTGSSIVYKFNFTNDNSLSQTGCELIVDGASTAANPDATTIYSGVV